MTEQEIEAMIQRAAEAGARKALRDVGLHDDGAMHDVNEIRSLLDSWRSVRRTAGKTAVQIITSMLLGFILAGTAASSYFNFFDKP
jgi:hypothetical protein